MFDFSYDTRLIRALMGLAYLGLKQYRRGALDGFDSFRWKVKTLNGQPPSDMNLLLLYMSHKPDVPVLIGTASEWSLYRAEHISSSMRPYHMLDNYKSFLSRKTGSFVRLLRVVRVYPESAVLNQFNRRTKWIEESAENVAA